jgi:hypothetical protein
MRARQSTSLEHTKNVHILLGNDADIPCGLVASANDFLPGAEKLPAPLFNPM